MPKVYPPRSPAGNGTEHPLPTASMCDTHIGGIRDVSVAANRTVRPSSTPTSLHDENQTLYGVIRLVSSSLEMLPMLQGVVDLATEATGCHACFIYLLEDGLLTIRAASPVFADAVGNVQMSLDEGLTGWVARHRTPEFIRDRAMKDPRMKYIPL